MWLECIGVVSECCYKEVYRYPHNNTYPYSTCIGSFLQQHPYFFIHFKNVFSFLFILFLCNIANTVNVAQRTFEIVQKSRSCEHGNIIISTRMYVDCTHARVPTLPRLPCARYRLTFQESCS